MMANSLFLNSAGIRGREMLNEKSTRHRHNTTSAWTDCLICLALVLLTHNRYESVEMQSLFVQLILANNLLPEHLLRILMDAISLPAKVGIQLGRRIANVESVRLDLSKMSKKARIRHGQCSTTPERACKLLQLSMFGQNFHGFFQMRVVDKAAFLAALEKWNCTRCGIVEAKPESAEMGDICQTDEVQPQA